MREYFEFFRRPQKTKTESEREKETESERATRACARSLLEKQRSPKGIRVKKLV